MTNKIEYLDRIMDKLGELNIYKVILFGSYANGRGDPYSEVVSPFLNNDLYGYLLRK